MDRPLLTAKQQAFVREYVEDWNASAAALRAGYKHGEEGRRLIRNPTVREALAVELDEIRQQTFISRESQLRDLRKIAADEACPHSTRVAATKHASELFGLTRDTDAVADTEPTVPEMLEEMYAIAQRLPGAGEPDGGVRPDAPEGADEGRPDPAVPPERGAEAP